MAIDLAAWSEANVLLEGGKPLRLMKHQRKILTRSFKLDADGKLPYSTVLYSCVKKDGESTINAVVCLWFGYELEPGSEIIIAANDFEQASGRVFRMCANTIERSPVLKSKLKAITSRDITLTNGTVFRAIPTDAAGEAGANQSLASFDELWGYVSERSRRLYDELTPTPTRKNSIRLITTYAGYEGESELLEELYRRAMAGRRLWTLLPCYENGSLFAYWDHKPRAPWQTPEYLAAERQELRPNAYLRLHENRWVSSESVLIDMATQWTLCISKHHATPTAGLDLFVGVDASVKRDRAAVVSVYWGDDERLYLGPMRSWQPSKSEPLDLEETLEAYIKELADRHDIIACAYDPYQFHRSAMTLEKANIIMREFPQTQDRLTKMTSDFLDLLTHKAIVLYPQKDLTRAAKQATGKETPRGVRITKDKASKKIDELIALAMACTAALEDAPDDGPSIRYVGPSAREVARHVDTLVKRSPYFNPPQGTPFPEGGD